VTERRTADDKSRQDAGIMNLFGVRPRSSFFILLIICLLSPASVPLAAQPAPGDMLAAVNAARAGEGLPPLAMNGWLTAAACRQAQDLAGRALHDVEALSHQGRDGSTLAVRLQEAGYAYRTAAENLAAGVADPQETVRLWLASAGHRRNLLNPAVREAGAAYLGPRLSPGGNRQGPLDVWVLVLAAPSTPGGLAPPPPPAAKNPKDCAG
jgi:hypothetical protein